MQTAFSGDLLLVLEGETVAASVRLQREGDMLFFVDLRGTGNPGALRTIFRFACSLDEPVYLAVDESNPDRERLLRIYRRYGAQTHTTILRLDNHG